jgi:hypothetical protein
MEYYLDTEFIEDGKTIDLISIGMVCEDGMEYQAVNQECNFYKANSWVIENVLEPMSIKVPKKLNRSKEDVEIPDPETRKSQNWRTKEEIALEVIRFVKAPELFFGNNSLETQEKALNILVHTEELIKFEPKEKPVFWGWYSDYDWVVFCQLFGTMTQLPPGLPMYCRDLKQECDRLGNPSLPEQTEGKHNALLDARWNRDVASFLKEYEQGITRERTSE